MCNDVMRASRGACTQASRPPKLYVVRQKLLMDVPFRQANARRMHAGKPAALIICRVPGITYGRAVRASQTIFIKNNRLTF